MKNTHIFVIVLVILGLSLTWWQLRGRNMLDMTLALATINQIKLIDAAKSDFYDKNGALPGKKNAAIDLSPRDFNRLFWQQLQDAGLLTPEQVMEQPVVGGAFIAVRMDDLNFSAGVRPENAKLDGVALVIADASARDNPSEIEQGESTPLTPFQMLGLDAGKFDDRNPAKGVHQAFGRKCFVKINGEYVYNMELSHEKVCGIIMGIGN